MNRSITLSASSTSIGTGGFLPSGLYRLLETALPAFLMFWRRKHISRRRGPLGEQLGTYIDLLVGPAIHTQRLHLGHVGAQLAVDGGASHAQEDAQLNPPNQRQYHR